VLKRFEKIAWFGALALSSVALISSRFWNLEVLVRLTEQPSQDDSFEFVGGPYDGRHLKVDPPPTTEVELVVHAVGKGAPAEFYVLHDDGRFHYSPPPQQH
jgi:hypothetical protein